ncbi:MAG: hypothetical protein DRP45_03710 [Candidatus Zixiibacteriota bacterium]|nr:MAG: hypothetical protein DRP45_03710 [candidate division Zixibacteria bacterium]
MSVRFHMKWCPIFTTCLLLLCSCKQNSEPPNDNTLADTLPLIEDSLVRPGTPEAHAEALTRFPAANLIDKSFVYHRTAFLEVVGLDDVYSARYTCDGDTLELFLTQDSLGFKYLKITEFGTRHSQVVPAADEFEFDHGYSVLFHHGDHGRIIAGLRHGRLVGALGYRDSCRDFLARWVRAMTK